MVVWPFIMSFGLFIQDTYSSSESFHFNGEQTAVLDMKTVPINNKMMSAIIEKFSGSSRHGRQMRSLQVQIDAGEEQMKKLAKHKEDIEKEKKDSKEYYILKCFQLDQMIAEKDKLVKKQEKIVDKLKEERLAAQRIVTQGMMKDGRSHFLPKNSHVRKFPKKHEFRSLH
uniref:NAM-associated domain-containing protein n=2 Tax=Caenorhabditis tropicalis TaxID=1561998 RepID=A0A1I7TGK1_9PELO